MNEQGWLNYALASMHNGQWFGFSSKEQNYSTLIVHDSSITKPTEVEVNAKIQEIKYAEAKKIAAEKEKIKNEIKLAKEELINELKKLGKDPVVTLSEIDSDEDIKALRNQLKAIKEEVEKEGRVGVD